MKVKAVISAALLCAFAISASGCDGADIGTDNLIRPPKTVGDEAEIEQLIADTAGSGYTLKYPKSGNYRRAIVIVTASFRRVEALRKLRLRRNRC